MLTLSDFDFDLPPELIAQTALPDRTASRLLAVRRAGDAVHFEDRQFADLVDYLRPGDLLVFNDTRVIKARFFGQKASGGKVEVLVERLLDEHTVLAQIRSSKSPVEGTTLRLADAFDVTVGPRAEPFFTLRFPQPALDLIEQYGRLPLPPYIEHDPDSFDETRYQTVYARNPGAVAAPTAGLHFDDALFAKLDAMGIQRGFLTLHVGAGTFQPVRVENIAEHRMHSEWYEITAELAEAIRATRAAGGRIIAVGTTSASAHTWFASPISAARAALRARKHWCRAGQAHVLLGGSSIISGLTLAPGRTRAMPLTTMVSSPLRPDWITRYPSTFGPSTTSFCWMTFSGPTT